MAIQFLNGLESLGGTITITKSTTAPLMYLYNTTNGGGAAIRFSDQDPTPAQTGDLTYFHQDGSSQGGGASFHFTSEPDTTLVVGNSTNTGRFVSKSGGNGGEVDYGFYDDVNTGMFRSAADTVRLAAGGISGLNVSVNTVDLRYAGTTKISTTSVGVSIAGNITLTGTGRIQGIDTVSASTDAANKAYVDASVARVTPATPSTISSSVVGETIEIAFNQSATSNIDYYQVWSSDDGGDYGIIAQVTPADFSSTMTVVDTTFVTGGTMSYRIFAVREGIYSTAGTTSQSYTVGALDVFNMTVVTLNTAYYIQYEKPTTRFIDHIEIYMDSQTTSAALSRSNATIVYSGQNSSYMRNVNASNNFHQFWVEVVTT